MQLHGGLTLGSIGAAAMLYLLRVRPHNRPAKT